MNPGGKIGPKHEKRMKIFFFFTCSIVLSFFLSGIVVSAEIIGDFTGIPNTGTAPLTVTFLDQSTGTSAYSSYVWDFGDNSNFSTEKNPTHTYLGTGYYNVSLTIKGSYGAGKTFTKPSYIKVEPSEYPVVKFATTTQKGPSPLMVSFFDQSELDPAVPDEMYNYIWDFGDGYTDTTNEHNPRHTYTEIGEYQVTLEIKDQNGDKYETVNPVFINVTNGTQSLFSASFSAIPLSGSAPLTVSFIDQSVSPSPITHYSWYFGDGSPLSHERNPVHTYEGIGIYTTTLTIMNSESEKDTKTMSSSVHVLPSEYPVVRYSAIPLNASVSQTVFFQDQSELDPSVPDEMYNYLWDFGDGTTDYSNTRNIQHKYESPGSYEVLLTIQDQNGAKYNSPDPVMITITNGSSQLYASFTAIPETGMAPLQVSFIDQSINPESIIGYLWDFGDGNPLSTEKNPSHTYVGEGKYHVSLTVSYVDGVNKTITLPEYIHVQPSEYPDIKFTAIPLVVSTSEEVYFIDQSILDPTVPDEMYNYIWDFGDGTKSNTTENRNIQHRYENPGIYTARLEVQDQNGALYRSADSVKIIVNSEIKQTIINSVSEKEVILSVPKPIQENKENIELTSPEIKYPIYTKPVNKISNLSENIGPTPKLIVNKSEQTGFISPISKRDFTITTISSPNGEILPSGKISVPEETEKVFTIVPESGYYIGDVKINENSIGQVTGYTFCNITSDQTISAEFLPIVTEEKNETDVNSVITPVASDQTITEKHISGEQKVPPTAKLTIITPFIEINKDAIFKANVSGPHLDPLQWDFGDNCTEVGNNNPTHKYRTIGSFNVTITVTNPYGKAVARSLVQVR